MSKHIHQWVLIDKWDSKAEISRPKVVNNYYGRSGFWGGGYIPATELLRDINIRIIESINKSLEPRYTSETWACHCGKTKTNHHEFDIHKVLNKLATPPK